MRTKPKKTEQKNLKGKDVFKTVKKPNPYLERRNGQRVENTNKWRFLSLDNDIQAYNIQANNKKLRNGHEQLIFWGSFRIYCSYENTDSDNTLYAIMNSRA